jgi:hypothetical protein
MSAKAPEAQLKIFAEALNRIADGFDKPIDDVGGTVKIPLPAGEAQQIARFALLAALSKQEESRPSSDASRHRGGE